VAEGAGKVKLIPGEFRKKMTSQAVVNLAGMFISIHALLA
jgi:hypothetical protein